MVGSFLTVTMIAMRGDRDDGGSTGPASPGLRTAGWAAGSCLAVGATVGVFLTEDPQLLRLAVVAAAWAFVLAALVASRRSAAGAPADGGERAAVERADLERADLERAAAEREAELRLAHARELQREIAARREHELRVEDDLRHTVEQSMRAELEALRSELAQVSGLRWEMGQLAELRREVAEVAGLRRDLADLAELRTALAGLDLTALAELHTDVGRLRRELTEQLSGEMLVERVMLRTQSSRPASAGAPGGWEGPPPESTAAWPAVRAEAPAVGSRQPAEVRIGSRPPAPLPTGRPLLDPPSPPPVEPELHRRRTDDPFPPLPPAPDELLTAGGPVAQRQRPPVPGPPAVAPADEAPGEPVTRLAEPIGESGLTPPSGGRRRRRYREDDETDDVLARVLGR